MKIDECTVCGREVQYHYSSDQEEDASDQIYERAAEQHGEDN